MPLRPQILSLALALLIAGCGSSSSSSSSSSSAQQPVAPTPAQTAQPGFEGVAIEPGPDLAPPGTTGTGKVDGIQCGATEQLAYHVHVHLAVYVNGSPRAPPGGIGIPGSRIVQTAEGPEANGGICIYWLHTHAPDGVIHIESPTRRIYTLGNFFDEWHQPLGTGNVAGNKGPVSAFVDGKPWTKNLRSIPLDPHSVIQLSVGEPPVPFHPMSWAGTQL